MATLYTGRLAGLDFKDGVPVDADGDELDTVEDPARTARALRGYMQRHGLQVDDDGRLVVPDPREPAPARDHPAHVRVGTPLQDVAVSTAEPPGDSDGGSADSGSAAGEPAGDDGSPSEETPEEPSGNAATDVWRAYALATGATEEDIDGLGRNDLRARYGS